VARRHGFFKDTVYNWLQAKRKSGSVILLPYDVNQRLLEAENRLESLAGENDQLKKTCGGKEVELAILRELRDRVNPQ